VLSPLTLINYFSVTALARICVIVANYSVIYTMCVDHITRSSYLLLNGENCRFVVFVLTENVLPRRFRPKISTKFEELSFICSQGIRYIRVQYSYSGLVQNFVRISVELS